MTITFISDTHGLHDQLKLPDTTDMIIHAGDLSGMGRIYEIKKFLAWYASLPHRYKIFIGGNHDFLLEQNPTTFRALLEEYPDLIYLENEEVVIEGIKIWGSPISPFFHNWAFNRYRGSKIRKYWEMIPTDTDILVTHGPPKGIGDRVIRGGEEVGCADLLEVVQKIKPRYHVFGHIHEDYGMVEKGGTTYINASVLDEKYKLCHAPVVVTWSNTDC